MMVIPCPHCGPRAQAEFTYARSLDAVVPPDAAPETAVAALYTRANLKAEDDEIWHHAHGCGAWLVLRRHRVSHAIRAVRLLGPEALP